MLYFARRVARRGFSTKFQQLQCGLHCNHSDMFLTEFAKGRGMQYCLETTETERINDMLKHYHLQKWGFIIYRCTYGDDSAWDRFMHRLNACKDAALIDMYDDEYLAKHLDWNVQQDPSLDNATKDQVRDKFRTWVATDARTEFPTSADYQDKIRGLLQELPRYKYCIHVDAESMQSVLDGPSPTEPDLHSVSYVNLVRADDAWEAWEKESAEVRDDREPELEGRTSLDVGWMKVAVRGLVPEVYETLVNDYMWDVFYVRPNKGVWNR
jgi:hypothetical protein